MHTLMHTAGSAAPCPPWTCSLSPPALLAHLGLAPKRFAGRVDDGHQALVDQVRHRLGQVADGALRAVRVGCGVSGVESARASVRVHTVARAAPDLEHGLVGDDVERGA